MKTRLQCNADSFDDWLARHGVDYERGGESGGSQYFYIETDSESYTVRFSNHSPPPGGGYSVEHGYQHGDASISVHPGGKTPADARTFVASVHPDWPARSISAETELAAQLDREIAYYEKTIRSREAAIAKAKERGESAGLLLELLPGEKRELKKLRARNRTMTS